jgi:hypothetical protein
MDHRPDHSGGRWTSLRPMGPIWNRGGKVLMLSTAYFPFCTITRTLPMDL